MLTARAPLSLRASRLLEACERLFGALPPGEVIHLLPAEPNAVFSKRVNWDSRASMKDIRDEAA